MVSLWIFSISGIGIVLMLGFKLVEERLGGINWWANLVTSWDKKIHDFIDRSKARWQLSKKIVHIFIFEFLPAYLYQQSVKLKDYMYKKYYESTHSLRGEKRMLRTNGSVSEFLQSIAKESVEGKIVE